MQRGTVPDRADWLAMHRGWHHATDLAAWAGAACVTLGLALMCIRMLGGLEQRAGNHAVLDHAVMIDLPPADSIPPAIATLEAAPDVPMVRLPDQMEQVAQEKTAHVRPTPEEMPPLTSTMPQTAQPDPPDLPIEAESPPERTQAARPAPKPQDAPKKPAEEKPGESAKAVPKPAQAQKAAAAASQGQVKSLTAKWGAAIRKKVERRKSYPKTAGGAEGTATVRLSVAPNGGLAGVVLVQSSGNAALDGAALAAVSRVGRFPAAPVGLTEGQYTFNLPISFSR